MFEYALSIRNFNPERHNRDAEFQVRLQTAYSTYALDIHTDSNQGKPPAWTPGATVPAQRRPRGF